MITTTHTIPGVSVELLLALHELFRGDALCSKIIESVGNVPDADPVKWRKWTEGHKSLPLVGLRSSQFNEKHGTYTVVFDMLCECILENVVVTEQSVNYGRQLAKKLRFRPSSEPLLLIYRTLGLLDDAERLEAVE